MAHRLSFTTDPADVIGGASLLVIGRRAALASKVVTRQLPESLEPKAWRDMVGRNDPGDGGRAVTTYTGGRPMKIVAGILPEVCSRHNAPSRAWAVPKLVRATKQKGSNGILAVVESADHAFAVAAAIARAVPAYTGKSQPPKRTWTVCIVTPEGPVADIEPLEAVARAGQTTARLVDSPPNVLTTTALVRHATALSKLDRVTAKVFRGDELIDEGLLGLHGVGRTAIEPPAMVVLDYTPEGDLPHHAWVGKGIVYDTGGLSLKGKTTMPGMKTDMGGAAAVVAAFEGAVKLNAPLRITAILCIAENAIGPAAMRPDDVVRMYSGKTVEINNTDAEGRLVLADGLAWVAKNRSPDRMIDLATLTGAQSTATGKQHAAVYASEGDFERQAVLAGRASGDLVHPIPFVPEFFRAEFTSQVADMKNSVKRRNNAQSSCAGQFIYNHLNGFTGPWLHVDMAGPATNANGATGYGAALLLTLAGVGAPVAS